MLKIRLQRVGKKKKPAYRFVVSESTKDLYGKHLEILGHYDPFTKVIEVKKDRIQYWISVGAQPSPTAHNLLVDQNVIDKPKVVASKGKKKKKDGEEEAKPAAKPAEAPAKEEDKPAEEPKAEEKVEEKKEEPKAEDKPAEEPKAEEKSEEPKEEAKEEKAEEKKE